MKRFMILASIAIVALVTLLDSGQAQDTKATVSPLDKIKNGPKYAVADLAVVELSGAYDGTDYHVGGTVKNVGTGEYTRTRSLGGAFEGRTVSVYAVNKSRLGRAKLLRTYSVPSLKVGETWATPSMKISPREVPGTGNAQFFMMLSKGDADRKNDIKLITVSLVR